MNGRVAKTLRGRFGSKTSAYRRAKRQIDQAPTSFAQRPKLVAQRARKQREGAAPSWPRTEDQKQQSRPVIELRRAWPGQNHETGRIAA